MSRVTQSFTGQNAPFTAMTLRRATVTGSAVLVGSASVTGITLVQRAIRAHGISMALVQTQIVPSSVIQG